MGNHIVNEQQTHQGSSDDLPCNVCNNNVPLPNAKDEINDEPTVATPLRPYAYMHSGCPLNRREVGRAGWALLHTMAAYYPKNPTATQEKDMETFLNLFVRLYPCGYCSDMSRDECIRNPPRVGSQQELSQWMCELHNEVNDRMGKRLFDCSRVDERWRYGPSDGTCD